MARAKRTKKLRSIAEPFVVAPPTGTSTRTRLHPTPAEDKVLRQIGVYLGGLYRKDVVARTKIGVVPALLTGRTKRKRDLSALTSSRWAGSITRAAEDQYTLGMRGLIAECESLSTAIRKLEQRLAVPVGTKNDAGIPGYRNRRERVAKTRRLTVLHGRLRSAEASKTRGAPTIVLGGGKLWRNRQNLAQAGLSIEQWRARWDAARMFLTADGELNAPFGNQTIRVEADGILQVKVPTALVSELGPTLRLAAPVAFALRGEERADRAGAQQSIRYDITFDPANDRWYLHASWSYKNIVTPPLSALQSSPVIGVDLNADHLAAGIVDASGNPVGTPIVIPLNVDALSAGVRDGHLRQAISTLIRYAKDSGAGAIAIENLNFQGARSAGRETMGRGRKGKRFRRLVAGIPTGKFRERLTAMAANHDIHIIAVDPAYTSQWGEQHWKKPLQQRTSDTTVTRHQAAAIAIGRRAHGHRIKRRKDGDRTRQRTRPTPPRSDATMKPVNARPRKVRPAANLQS